MAPFLPLSRRGQTPRRSLEAGFGNRPAPALASFQGSCDRPLCQPPKGVSSLSRAAVSGHRSAPGQPPLFGMVSHCSAEVAPKVAPNLGCSRLGRGGRSPPGLVQTTSFRKAIAKVTDASRSTFKSEVHSAPPAQHSSRPRAGGGSPAPSATPSRTSTRPSVRRRRWKGRALSRARSTRRRETTGP